MENKQNQNESITVDYEFFECEHGGDLDDIIYDIHKSGGFVISSDHDYEEETCVCTIKVDDLEAFKSQFATTQAYNFTNI